MKTTVAIPWRGGCEHRDAALRWTIGRYADTFADVELIFGACDPDVPFNRAEAILDAARKTDRDVLIVADADCFTSGLVDAVNTVRDGAPWAVPHLMLHRLSQAATERVLAGEPPEEQTELNERPYRGHETGTLLVIRREVLFDVPPDVRMVGWGQEDDAWAMALRTLVGPPWRGTQPLWHLWHPPQPRISRRVGTRENDKLLRRYAAARRKPDAMRALIAENEVPRVSAP